MICWKASKYMVLFGAKDGNSPSLSLLGGHESTILMKILDFVPDHQAKVVLIGEKNVGKTHFVKRLMNVEFDRRDDVNTIFHQVHVVNLKTDHGTIQTEFHDIPGIDLRKACAGGGGGVHTGFLSQHFDEADAVIAMYVLTDCDFFDDLGIVLRHLRVRQPYLPIAMCANQSDLGWGQDPIHVSFRLRALAIRRRLKGHRKTRHFETSVIRNENWNNVLRYLAIMMVGSDTLSFLVNPIP